MINPYQFGYIIHSGKVISNQDRDTHVIPGTRLLQLYGLPRDVKYVLDQEVDFNWNYKRGVEVQTLYGLPVLHLYPDTTGKYSLDDAIFQCALERL